MRADDRRQTRREPMRGAGPTRPGATSAGGRVGSGDRTVNADRRRNDLDCPERVEIERCPLIGPSMLRTWSGALQQGRRPERPGPAGRPAGPVGPAGTRSEAGERCRPVPVKGIAPRSDSPGKYVHPGFGSKNETTSRCRLVRSTSGSGGRIIENGANRVLVEPIDDPPEGPSPASRGASFRKTEPKRASNELPLPILEDDAGSSPPARPGRPFHGPDAAAQTVIHRRPRVARRVRRAR